MSRLALRCSLLAVLLCGLPQAAVGQKAMARVQKAEQAAGVWEVVIDAGRLDGVQPEAEVVLLRAGEPIVHPLSGVVLGVPQEPVGRARVFAMEDRSARAVLLKLYSTPKREDMVEYDKGPVRPLQTRSAPKPQAASAAADQVLERVEALERRVQRVQQGQASAADQLPARRVWDELEVMKSYLLALDERLVQVEHHQGEQGRRINALSGAVPAEQMEELTIRYSKDTQLKLRVDGKTLIVDIEADTLRLKRPVAAAVAPPKTEKSWWAGLFGQSDGDDPIEVEPEEELAPLLPADAAVDGADQMEQPAEGAAEPWYKSPWTAAVTAALALAGGSLYLMHRRREYEELLAEVDDVEGLFDDDSDEGDDDEDDEEEEEYEDDRRFRR